MFLLKRISTISKTNDFWGESDFGQLISLVNSKIKSDTYKAYAFDRYLKNLNTKDYMNKREILCQQNIPH